MNSAALVPVVLAGGALALVALHRFPLLGVLAIAALTLTEWEHPAQAPLFAVAGSNVFPLDVLCALMVLIAGCNGRTVVRTTGLARFAWYGLCLLLVVGLLRGAAAFGLSTSVNEFRGFLYPIAVMTWAMSLPWTEQQVRRLIGTVSLVQGWALVLLAVAHIGVYGFGSADDEIQFATGTTQTLRPLVSSQSLALLFCAVAVIALAKEGRPLTRRISGGVFLVVVLIVQQRTVWAAAVAVLATVLLAGSMRQRRALFGVAGVLLLLAAFALPAVLRSAAFADLVASSESSGTYEGRVISWGALIAQSLTRGPADVLFGIPSGFGWGRFEGPGRWVEWPPHNWYVSVYLRAGLAGLALLLIFMALVTGRLLRRGGAGAAALAIVVATAVYGWSYSWLVETAVFAGWAVAVGVRRYGRRSAERVEPAASADGRVARQPDPIGVPFSGDREGFGSTV